VPPSRRQPSSSPSRRPRVAGLRKPSAEILQQIARALQISAESLYERAGLLSPDNKPRVGVREAIAADQDLTAEQRQALLNVYESFVAARH